MDSITSIWVTGPCDHHNTQWSMLDGGILDIIHEDSINVRFDRPGEYRIAVQAESRCGMRYDTLRIDVEDCTPPPLDTCPIGKEGNVWFLGESGLDFNSGTATERTGFAVRAGETQTSICDKDGRLLMYFDGDDLYDRSNTIMNGGDDLNPGGRSTTQSVILKKPNSDSLYYLFFTEAVRGGDPLSRDTIKQLFYVQVDLTLSGGLGAVIGPKESILQPSTEKVTAIPHCNNRDYWIVGSEGGSNRFFAWLLDKDSLHQNSPVISFSGPGNNGIDASKAGFLKPSHDGAILVEAISSEDRQGRLRTHDFDASVGTVSYRTSLIENGFRGVYGIEFSPNNSRLYFTGNGRLWQANLWAENPTAIRNSFTELIQFNGGGPTLGPDGKIYVTKLSLRSNGLLVVNAPNELGLSCDVVDDQNILSIMTGLGAPNFPAGFLFPERLYTRYPDTIICMDSLVSIWVTGPCDHHNTQWSLLDGGTLDSINEDSINLRFDTPGEYRIAVQAESRCGMRYDTINLRVKDCRCPVEAGEIDVSADTLIGCENDTLFIDFLGGDFLESGDSLAFVLHDRSDETLGLVSGYFQEGKCHFIAGMEYGKVYYYSSIAGNKLLGAVDLNDPCLSVAPGQPVVFYPIPKLHFIDVPQMKCADSCVEVTLVFEGVPNYQYKVRDERIINGQPVPAEYKTASMDTVQFQWCQDTVNLGSLLDRHCTNEDLDTTIVIRSIQLPQINRLDFDMSVCDGDSMDIVVASNAQQTQLINLESGLSRTITNDVTLGPFTGDSCYSVLFYNELGCSVDSQFCISILPVFNNIRDTFLLCEGDSLVLPDGSYARQANDYTVGFKTIDGCDSTGIWTVRVEQPPTVTGLLSRYFICQGDSLVLDFMTDATTIELYDSQMDTSRVINLPYTLENVEANSCYELRLDNQNPGFCTTLETFCVEVFPTYQFVDTFIICEGDSVQLQDGRFYKNPGMVPIEFQSLDQCDSSYVNYIEIISSPSVSNHTASQAICQDEDVIIDFQTNAQSIVLRNNISSNEVEIKSLPFRIEGIVSDSCYKLILSNGNTDCDLMLDFCIQVNPVYQSNDTIFKCPTDSVLLPNGSFTVDAGEFVFDYRSKEDCDSSIIVSVFDYPELEYEISTQKACFQEANGMTEIKLRMGQEDFNVVWPDGDTSKIRSDLPSGAYDVTTIDHNGCAQSIIIVIGEENELDFTILKQDESCFGENDGWILIQGRADSFLLDGEIYQVSDTVRFLSPGQYDIEILGEQERCNLDTFITILEGEVIVADLPEQIISSGGAVELPLTVIDGIPTSYLWSPSFELSCLDCPRPTSSTSVDTTYNVVITTSNGCALEKSIRVLIHRSVFVPTVFSPNGDNINDDFKPYFSDPDQEYTLSIYSRWGNLVFSCTGVNCGWDGTFNGEILDPSVFVFVVEHDEGGETTQQRGSVTLVR